MISSPVAHLVEYTCLVGHVKINHEVLSSILALHNFILGASQTLMFNGTYGYISKKPT
jgi:hypothetical protein